MHPFFEDCREKVGGKNTPPQCHAVMGMLPVRAGGINR
jgi:hypothetical protein